MLSVFYALFLASAGALKIAKPEGRILSEVVQPDVSPQPQEGPQSPFIDGLQDLLNKELNAGFVSRIAHQPFEASLAAASDAARSDPCSADLLANGFGYPYGFGARAGMAADELQLAAYFNKSVALCDGDSYQTGINFHDFFVSPIGVCKDPGACFAGRTAAPFIGCAMSQKMKDVDYEFAVYLKRTAYQTMFGTFNAETQAHVSAALVEAGLQRGSEYVGVHMRRGDKKRELKRNHKRMNTTAEYAGVVLQELGSRGLNTVYLASDDEFAKDELLDLLRQSTPDVQVIQQFSPDSVERTYADDAEGTLAFLVDVAALRGATVFIGTQSSSTGRLVYLLRDKASDSISTDGGWLDNAEFI